MSRLIPAIRVAATCLLILAAATDRAVLANDGDTVLVFAAASTREAVEAVLNLAERKHGISSAASFAGSGTLARQIEAGAPVDLYLSANSDWMERLAQSGSIVQDSRIDLVANTLVVIAPSHPHATSTGPATLSASWLSKQLAGEQLAGGRLAIGDPRAVPAGIYARQALENLGLWSAVAGHLAPTSDVRTALALVERGAVPLGIVYRTDAIASNDVTIMADIPADSHDPIRYPLAMTPQGTRSAAAQRLMALFQSPEGLQAFSARGFLPVE
jgi:molybdate transport system substrate-binding protein